MLPDTVKFSSLVFSLLLFGFDRADDMEHTVIVSVIEIRCDVIFKIQPDVTFALEPLMWHYTWSSISEFAFRDSPGVSRETDFAFHDQTRISRMWKLIAQYGVWFGRRPHCDLRNRNGYGDGYGVMVCRSSICWQITNFSIQKIICFSGKPRTFFF